MRRQTAAARVPRRPAPTRWNPRATFVAVALAVVATMVASLTAAARTTAKSPLDAGMAALLTSYSADTGLIGNSWWQAAVALSTIETYAQGTGDNSYNMAFANAFVLQSGRNFESSSDDDTAWWALVWLQAYDITHMPSYLSMAATEADYIHEGWDDTCGGGVWWQRRPHWYKNAITNELFLELTAWLHNRIPGDVKYLRWAKAEWSWFDHSGMINKGGLVNDGLDDHCKNNTDITWSYNQGVILAGLAQLYQATGNRSLLTRAEHIASAAIRQLTVGGVLAEPCERASCAVRLDDDTRSFKGIFVRDLKVLAVTARTARFNAFFTRQARSIEAHDSTGRGKLGMFWAGPVEGVSSSSQASALDALVASLRLPLPAVGARQVSAPRIAVPSLLHHAEPPRQLL